MKNLQLFIYLIVIFMAFVVWPVPSSAAEDLPWDIKLPFKSAIIHYEVSGMEKGRETLYVKEYGKYRALHHEGTTSIFGMTTKNRRIEITDPDWQYTIDLEKQTGSKITNPRKFYLDEYNKLTADEKKNVRKNAQELSVSMLRDMNAQTIEKATTILGYECDRTTIMGGITLSMIHKTDIPLLTEMNLPMMNSKILATKIDESAPPADAFDLPDGITVVHDQQSEAMVKQMASHYIATLKEPDGAEKMRSQMSVSEVEEQYSMDPSMGDEEAAMAMDEEEAVVDEDAIDEAPPSPAQDDLQKSMDEGMKLLKGLFGN